MTRHRRVARLVSLAVVAVLVGFIALVGTLRVQLTPQRGAPSIAATISVPHAYHPSAQQAHGRQFESPLLDSRPPLLLDPGHVLDRPDRARWSSDVAAKTADEGISGGRYLFNNWYKGTFPNRTQSVNYHVAQHGNGRSAVKYTQDAMDFFAQNRSMGVPVTLRDGTAGFKIATKQPLPGGSTQNIGGYWTGAGRLVTFWD